jgi:hypothetical protein
MRPTAPPAFSTRPGRRLAVELSSMPRYCGRLPSISVRKRCDCPCPYGWLCCERSGTRVAIYSRAVLSFGIYVANWSAEGG